MTEGKAKNIIRQVLKAVDYLHRNRILHRDVKPQNILINMKGEVKLADFGLSRTITFPVKNLTLECCTLWYRPPEMLLGSKKYSINIDIWPIGCIFVELLN
jgi:cyclin-dependent kinase